MAQYGGFWRRVGAYFIDLIILMIAASVLGAVLGFGTFQSEVATGADAFAASGGFYGDTALNLLSLVLGIAYFAGLESSAWQATLGKKALGMVVTDEAGRRISFLRALGRYFAKILSGLILFIGYIMVAFTARKRGLHDMLAGTLVYVGRPLAHDASVFE